MAKDPTPKEIREAFSDYSQTTSHIREEGKIDMRYVSGDPWDPEDRLAREDSRRPVMSFDEINQYLIQFTGSIRENPLAIEINPESDDATEPDAENRANTIRGIEYKSQAQQTYTCAGDSMVMRSYGYARLNKKPVDGKSFDMELVIKPILNPDTIIYSPSYRMPDGSDVEEVFEVDYLTRAEFRRKYPRAKVQSFTGEDMKVARNWIREDDIQIAGFWKAHIEYKTLLLVETDQGDVPMWEEDLLGQFDGRDKLGKFAKLRDVINVKREIKKEVRRVVQYVTNGLEIIDKVDWEGQRIPLPGCFGKQLFMDLGGGPKRHLFSMTRLMRDPQMFLAYAISQEAEEFGMAPKAPLQGFKGQFESDQESYENLNKVARSYIQADIPDDWPDGWGPPPLPSRPQFTPNIDKYEVARESSRQSIRSAAGLAMLPTAAQRMTEKSGVALDKIMKMEQVGMLHFFDNYKQFIANVGWQLNDLLGPVYDTQRNVPIVKPDGKRGLLRLNDDQYQVQPGEEKMDVLHTGKGTYGVIVSVGPSRDSERDAIQDLLDTLLEQIQNLGIAPEIAQKITAKAIRMRNLGPQANDIADLLDPPQDQQIPPELQATFTNLQAKVNKLAQENQALLLDRAGKVHELQNKLQVEGMRNQTAIAEKKWDYITRIVVAELAKGSKATEIAAQLSANKELNMLGFTHDREMAKHQSAHEVALAAATPPPPTAAPAE